MAHVTTYAVETGERVYKGEKSPKGGVYKVGAGKKGGGRKAKAGKKGKKKK